MAITISGEKVNFTMKLRKDALKGPEHSIEVTVNVAGVDKEALLEIVFSGASARVRLQSKLRKLSEAALEKIAQTGYKTSWNNLLQKDAQQDYKDALMGLSEAEFIKTITRDFGCTIEVAKNLYEAKHNNNKNNE